MSDAAEVRRALADRALYFCQDFLSGGAAHGKMWKCGDVYGSAPAGKNEGSMVVHLEGEKAGWWIDARTGQKGKDLIGVYMAQKDYGRSQFPLAMEELCKWAGIDQGRRGPGAAAGAAAGKPRTMRRFSATGAVWRGDTKRAVPPPQETWIPLDEQSAGWRYWVGERGISADALERARPGWETVWFPQTKKEHPAVAFPARTAEGDLLPMVKYRAEKDWTGLEERLTRSCSKAVAHLIGMHCADPSLGEPLVICEGESDWLAALSDGFQAVCIPFGATNHDWIENDLPWVELWPDVVLLWDNDEAGRKGRGEVFARLGAARCLLPDWLEEGDDYCAVRERDPGEAADLVQKARAVDPVSLRRAGEFRQEIHDLFFPPDGVEPGSPVAWKETFPFRYRPGELTLHTGYSGHGKTTGLSHQIVHDAATRGERALVFSLEVPAPKTLHRMCRQAGGIFKPVTRDDAGKTVPDLDLLGTLVDFLDDKVLLYGEVGELDATEVWDLARYCIRRYGVYHVVVDSLMKLVVNEEDTEGQKQSMNAAAALAADTGCHVHFVAHSKKPDAKKSEDRHPPKKHQVLGSVHLTNIPDNVVCMFRNGEKEELLDTLERSADKAESDMLRSRDPKEVQKAENALAESKKMLHAVRGRSDASFFVYKQRYGEGRANLRLNLFFDGPQRSEQFLEEADQISEQYVTAARPMGPAGAGGNDE